MGVDGGLGNKRRGRDMETRQWTCAWLAQVQLVLERASKRNMDLQKQEGIATAEK